MSNAINARVQGDDYQALFFWHYALKMFYPYTGVEKVVYEADNIKSFDDVVVYYKEDKPCLDCRHNPINIDFFQVKFHVVNDKAFTWDGLMDPKIINANSVSIMQRLKNAQEIYDADRTRFHLVSTWPIDSTDNLSKIVSNTENEIRIDKLFDGKSRSKMANMRQKMIKHLKLSTDEELKRILIPFRIWHNYPNTQRLVEELNTKLSCLGFKPIENNSILNPYVDLIKQWSLRGKNEFTKEFIMEECKSEGLYLGNKSSASEYVDVGIRSFYRRAENMQDETEKMLCLLKFFNGRYIKDGDYWNKDIFNELYDFTNVIIPNDKYRLYLDTHFSIAFVTGYLLDSKSGVEVYPIQKTRRGRKFWYYDENSNKNYADWKLNEIPQSKESKDVALVLGVTHNILNDVKGYIKENKIKVSKIINCSIGERPSNNAIIDGTHAKFLADSLSVILKEKRNAQEKRNKLHIFAACPNGFIFFLGQISRSFGKIVLYEHDFDGNKDEIYSKSFELPINLES